MKIKTHIIELVKFLISGFFMGLLLFLCSGKISHTNSWLFMGLYLIPTAIINNVLAIKNPELLKKRKDTMEDRPIQTKVTAFLLLAYYGVLIVSGLDIRFGWSALPEIVTIIASVGMLIGHLLFAEVLRENHYVSNSIKKQENHKLVDTGLYGVVRHPLYLANTTIYLSMALVLGSWIGLLVALTFPFIYAMRIKDEEEFLEEELEDYKDYKQRVKYRLIPFIW